MLAYTERVAERAAEVRFVQLLLTIIALPFFVLGWVVGLIWLAVRWCYAAVLVGFEQVAKREGVDDAR
jgi:hypothetical protein